MRKRVVSSRKKPAVADGRRQRTERSRKAIIDAALAYMEEGVLVPTAQQLADRAGIGIRSFFRHFEDMEALFQAVDDSIRDSYESLFLGGDRAGTLEERIEHAVERHADAYEAVSNIVRSTLAQSWRYEILRRNYARNQRGLRKDLNDWLPELNTLAAPEREAVDAIASFDMWHRLRYHQGLGKTASSQVIADLLKRLLL